MEKVQRVASAFYARRVTEDQRNPIEKLSAKHSVLGRQMLGEEEESEENRNENVAYVMWQNPEGYSTQ